MLDEAYHDHWRSCPAEVCYSNPKLHLELYWKSSGAYPGRLTSTMAEVAGLVGSIIAIIAAASLYRR